MLREDWCIGLGLPRTFIRWLRFYMVKKEKEKKMNKHLTEDGNIPNKIPLNQLSGSKPQIPL